MAFKVWFEESYGADPKPLHTINTAGDVYNKQELDDRSLKADTPATRADADFWAKRFKGSLSQNVHVYVETLP